MNARTDAISLIAAELSATAPSELQWLPNPGHEPEIPEGWELAHIILCNGEDANAQFGPWFWQYSLCDTDIAEYAIRRKPTQPSRIDAINASVHACNTAFGARPEPQGVRAQPTLDQALEQLRIEAECLQQPQSAALVISGRLTSVGETFATILTGTRTLADKLAGVSSQQVTLGINTEQARWLGKYVGGEVKLTVEVQL